MIDNTVVIVESKRVNLSISKVIIAYDETDAMNEDYSSLDYMVLSNLYKEGEFITAWDTSPALFRYNRIYFLDENDKVEAIFRILSKTQKEIRVDMRVRECNLYTIEDSLGDC
jgi:hypothetical protein